MNRLRLYSILTHVIVFIVSSVVVALCVHVWSGLGKLQDAVKISMGTLPYTNLGPGIIVGVITTVTSAILVFLNATKEVLRKRALNTPTFQIYWLTVLWLLWVIVGSMTLRDGDDVFGNQDCGHFNAKFAVPSGTRYVCYEVYSIAGLSYLNFAVVCLYTGVLVGRL
ncbi:hypothetical protein C8Q78DRAFT_700618 [Trametes maxima]|nr:hypothetical protein C8Q78DRAFT_700618 [Trametes maxima]